VLTINDKEELTQRGYRVDLWDALLVLEMMPKMGGGSRYAQAWRLSLYDLYDSLRKKIDSDPCVEYDGGPSTSGKTS